MKRKVSNTKNCVNKRIDEFCYKFKHLYSHFFHSTVNVVDTVNVPPPGDVDGDDEVVPGFPGGQVVGGLVEDVHQNGGQVGYHEDAEQLLLKLNCNS